MCRYVWLVSQRVFVNTSIAFTDLHEQSVKIGVRPHPLGHKLHEDGSQRGMLVYGYEALVEESPRGGKPSKRVSSGRCLPVHGKLWNSYDKSAFLENGGLFSFRFRVKLNRTIKAIINGALTYGLCNLTEDEIAAMEAIKSR